MPGSNVAAEDAVPFVNGVVPLRLGSGVGEPVVCGGTGDGERDGSGDKGA